MVDGVSDSDQPLRYLEWEHDAWKGSKGTAAVAGWDRLLFGMEGRTKIVRFERQESDVKNMVVVETPRAFG